MKAIISAITFLILVLVVLVFCKNQYVKPKLTEINIVTKGAGIGQTGGGVIEKSFISPKPYKVADAFEDVKIEKVYYTPMALEKTLPITMERDDNAQVSFTTNALFSLNAEKAHVTVVKFKNYSFEMQRILGKIMQYRLSKKSFGFKQAVSSNEELTVEELEKLNDFSDRTAIASELQSAFVEEFNKSFPDFPMIDMQQLPESKEKRTQALHNASFYFNGLALTSIDIDPELTKPFHKIAVSQYRTLKAEINKNIANTKGKIRVKQSENMAAAIRLEAQSITDELMEHLSRDVVLNAVENPDIDAILFVEINPDMSINFDNE
jgi:hypothetical protein